MNRLLRREWAELHRAQRGKQESVGPILCGIYKRGSRRVADLAVGEWLGMSWVEEEKRIGTDLFERRGHNGH